MSGIGARLLADHPATDDDFGPHARVAGGIQNLIDGSDGGKTIAVRGGWGAGKSTVIKLLSKHYAKSDVFVFVYDAWVHVGDPLRRAFLSSLVAALIGRGWLKGGKPWSDNQEKLAGRLKETTRRSIPQLTPFSKFLAMALLLVPTGTSLLSEGIKRSATSGEHGALLVIIGAVLSLLPVLGVGGAMICAARKGRSANAMFAFFVSRSITNEATVTTETGVASSIEFQEFFAKVVTDVLDDRNLKRKLVVVIDNLDRLEAEAAKEVWSLLRSFLDMPQHSESKWADRLWVLVPIASEGDAPSNAESTEPSEGFLTKIFQARFDLPPPVLKNWRPYLGSALSRAFPSITSTEKRQILDLYLASMAPGQALTPRELISFVNNLVALASQWSDSMSLAVLAAYFLDVRSHLGDNKTPGEALRKKEIPSEASERVMERPLRDEFAMIHFNTGIQKEALELLQRPEAERILASGDGEGLHAEIFKESSFGTISGLVIEEMKPLIRVDVSRLFLPLVAVYDAVALPQEPTNTAAIEELAETCKKAERLSHEVLSSMPGAPYATESFLRLADALLRVGKKTSVEAIIALMSRQTPIVADAIYLAPKTDATDAWADWVKGASRLVSHELIKEAINSGECIPFSGLSPQDYLALLGSISDSSTFNALARTSKQNLLPILEQGIQSRNFVHGNREIVDWCTARASREQLFTLAPLLEQALRNQDLAPGFVVVATQLLCELRDLGPIDAVLSNLVVAGVMHHHLFATQGFAPAAGAVVWCILAVRPGGNAEQFFGNGGNGQALLNQLLDNPRSQEVIARSMLDFCVSMGIQNDWIRYASTQPRLTNLLAFFTEDKSILGRFIASLKATDFRATIDDLASKIGRDLHEESLISSRFGDSDFLNELPSQLTGLNDAWLMTLSLQLLPDESQSVVIDNAVKMLRSLDEPLWLSQIDRNVDLQNLVVLLTSRNVDLALGGQLKSALRALLLRYKQDQSGDAVTVDKFRIFLEALSLDDRKSVADQAYEDLASSPGSPGAAWNVLEPLVSDSLARQRATLRIGRRLLLPMLNAEDADGLNCLARIFVHDWALSILREDPVALRDAQEKVGEMKSSGALDPKLDEALAKLATLWGSDATSG